MVWHTFLERNQQIVTKREKVRTEGGGKKVVQKVQHILRTTHKDYKSRTLLTQLLQNAFELHSQNIELALRLMLICFYEAYNSIF